LAISKGLDWREVKYILQRRKSADKSLFSKRIFRLCLNLQFFGAQLCAQRQPQRVENAAAGLRHSRAPVKSGHYQFFVSFGTIRG
jgi:hypothetical protein